jgi:predicted lipoprotein with Yx(FWY)xxD motif
MMRLALTALAIAGFLLATPILAQPAEISTRLSGMGAHLLSDKGYSLYTYDQDRPGLSSCNDARRRKSGWRLDADRASGRLAAMEL